MFNQVQRVALKIGLCLLAIPLLFPLWSLRWDVEYQYEYYYEADLPPAGGGTASPVEPPDSVKERYRDRESRLENRRGIILLPPRVPPPRIPPPVAEHTGTGAVDLGKRFTRCTSAAIANPVVRVDTTQMALEMGMIALPTILLTYFIRTRKKKVRLTFHYDPKDYETKT